MKGESTQKLLNDEDDDRDDGDDESLLAAGNSIRANVLWVWKCPNLFIQKDIWKDPQGATTVPSYSRTFKPNGKDKIIGKCTLNIIYNPLCYKMYFRGDTHNFFPLLAQGPDISLGARRSNQDTNMLIFFYPKQNLLILVVYPLKHNLLTSQRWEPIPKM